MAKKAKAAAKRERKLDKDGFEIDDAEDAVEDTGPKVSNEEIMQRVADLHARYDDGQMDLDTFDEERANLMSMMVID